jgi:putative membrane-bound dehydrogenase-like protein
MKHLALTGILLSLSASWVFVAEQRQALPQSKTVSVKLNGQTFTLPAGFEIELVAGPPLVNRPIVADFDDQGRLYVADSSGSNDPIVKQVKDRPHRIVRLESSKNDGKFDKSFVFADRMMFPEGVMWHEGSLYVAAPPSIWKLTDTNGDGIADERSEWFQGKTLTNCANDLHGPYAGPDGWIYWCKGAFAQQTYERPGGKPFVTRASHIFRCRPDGSGLEPVMTGGMDNPVDVVFTPGGERIFTTTFFQHPGGGKRDGLIHAVYGGIYGKDHGVIHEPVHKWTGPGLMPNLTHLGAAAPCGLVRYESSAFGPEYQDNIFAALFNMHKITRHVLTPSGATFTTTDRDFLVSDSIDFHPTDVIEDADGSLLVIDTGGWYKLCCPTSHFHKPDILGAIYRIRRKDAPHIDDPRGLAPAAMKRTLADLAKLLDDPRPAVRRRALQTLGRKGETAVPLLADVLRTSASVEARRNALRTATRIDNAAARAVVRTALVDRDETVRQVALHSISLHRDREAVPQLIELLKGPSSHNQRAAAEALGRIGDKKAVRALLEAAGKADDRVLEHAMTFALIEIADADEISKGLRSENALTRRAALVALDQTGATLKVETVARELNSPQSSMKETASWIVGRHPEWGDALAGYLRERLAAKKLTEVQREELANQLTRFAAAAAVQEMLAERLGDPEVPVATRQVVLRAMARSGLKTVPASWLASLTKTLAETNTQILLDAVKTARALPLPQQKNEDLVAGLLRVAQEETFPVELRLASLAAIPGGLSEVSARQFNLLWTRLDPDNPVIVRALAADVLARAKLTSEQLLGLADSVKTVGPMEIDRLLDAFVQSADDRVGTKLVAALKDASSSASLRGETLRPRLLKFGAEVRKAAEALYAKLDEDVLKQRAELEKVMASLKEGDIRRGQVVFHSQKLACASCHAIGYLGGNIGPDLTHIAKIRTERDLLESILFPSASLVRSYEPVSVTTKQGKIYNGLVRQDTPEALVLALTATEQVRVPRDEIEEMKPSKVSIMPAGLDKQLTPQDLADLLAFLKTCK